MFVDPQKLPGVIPGDPQKPIPVLSSLNYSMHISQKEQHLGSKEKERHGLFTWLLARPLRRALETVLGGQSVDPAGQKIEDFFANKGKVGEVWNDEMSISMLGKRLKKVVQNYQVRSDLEPEIFRTKTLFFYITNVFLAMNYFLYCVCVFKNYKKTFLVYLCHPVIPVKLL